MLAPAAVVSAFALVAVPVVVLMGVWTAVMVFRLVFPERPLPFDAAARRAAAQRRGEAVPVRLEDLLADQRRRAAAPRSCHPAGEADLPPALPSGRWTSDLWLRRN